jgi:hypothetical protein
VPLTISRFFQGAAIKKRLRQSAHGKLLLMHLEDRTTPSIAFAVGSGAGAPSSVNVYDENGTLLTTFQPYAPVFTGGVNVAVGDVTGDGVLDVITGAGPSGGPHVEVFDGAGLLGGIDRPLISFFAYASNFTGGVYVAAGDINSEAGEPDPPTGDARAEIVTGPGQGGGPDVRGFSSNADGTGLTQILEFNPFLATPGSEAFTGGVRLAMADFGGADGGIAGSKNLGDNEIACAPGPGIVGGVPGTGPTVQFWDYDGQEFEPDNFGSVTPDIGPNFTGGLFVAGGFFTNNRDQDGFVYADLVVSADSGGNAHQTIYRLDEFTSPDQRSGATYIIAGSPPGINVDTNLPEDVTPNTGLQSDVNVYGTSALPFHGGVRVGVISNPDPNGFDNLITGAGPGGGPHVKIFSGLDGTTGATTVVNQFMAFDINFTGGVGIG